MAKEVNHIQPEMRKRNRQELPAGCLLARGGRLASSSYPGASTVLLDVQYSVILCYSQASTMRPHLGILTGCDCGVSLSIRNRYAEAVRHPPRESIDNLIHASYSCLAGKFDHLRCLWRSLIRPQTSLVPSTSDRSSNFQSRSTISHCYLVDPRSEGDTTILSVLQ